MAEEYFQGEVCGGNWWNSSRNIFGSFPCSSNINEVTEFGWPNDMTVNMNTRSNDDSDSPSDGSIVLQAIQKPQEPDSEFIANGNISVGSTLQMMGNEISSSTPHNWNRDLFHENGRLSQGNSSHILQENLNSGMNYLHQTGMNSPQIRKDWNSNQGQDSSIYTSSLLKSLFNTDFQPHNSSLGNREINYQSPRSYLQMKYSNEFAPSFPQLISPLAKLSQPNKKSANHLQFSNNIPLLNATAASLNDIRASLLPSTQSKIPSSHIKGKPNLPEGVDKGRRSSVAKKTNSEPALKRPRIETPSPSPPTFKVRKEKLGDRITVLQQLVSPFGKTDTASVLQESIEYIKFLHNQLSVLSTAYIKNGSSVELSQAAADKQDLKSRGLCLVPISSTFPVAAETATDFWTPTFGGRFR